MRHHSPSTASNRSNAARPLEPADARAALAEVDMMRRAGARAGYPPRWFTVLAAVVLGANVAGQAFEGVSLDVTLAVSALALIGLAFVWRSRRVVGRRSSNRLYALASVVFLLMWVGPFVALYVGAYALDHRHGLAWAPWAAAAALSLWTFVLLELGRYARSGVESLTAMSEAGALAAPPPRWIGAAFAAGLGGNEAALALGLNGILAPHAVTIFFFEIGLAVVIVVLLGPGVVRPDILWLGRLAKGAPFLGVLTLYAAGVGGRLWLQADWPAWAAGAAIMAWTFAAIELARRSAGAERRHAEGA